MLRLLFMYLLTVAAGESGKNQEDLIWSTAPSAAMSVPAPPKVTRELREEGAKLYSVRCAACHGEQGDGRGPAAKRLKMPPTNFAKGVFKLRSTYPGTPPTDNDLFRTITRGVHGTPMIPWKQLSVRERWALVAKIKLLSGRSPQEPPAQVMEVPLPPDDSVELRAQGQKLYTLHRCGVCHGERGDANGPAAVHYRNASAERFVRIRDFSRGEFIRGPELSDIFLSLWTGFDGTPMGAYNDLPADDVWALAAYVRALAGQPPVH